MSGTSLASRLLAFFPTVYRQYGPLVARQYMYRAEAAGLLAATGGKTHSNDNACNSALMRLRRDGTIPWSAVLDASRSWQPTETGNPVSKEHYLGAILNYARNAADDYTVSFWAGQPVVPVVICEKEGLIPYFERVTSELQVTVYPIKGSAGASHLHENLVPWMKRARADAREVRLLYLGDYDDEGFKIEEGLNDALDEFGVETHAERLALTGDLVASHRIRLDPGNPKSTVYKKYIKEGVKAEIEALDPAVLVGLIRGAIEECLDTEIYVRAERKAARSRAWLRARLGRLVSTEGAAP